MKPRIVLAGGSGFIGQSLSPPLVSKNYEIVVLTRVNRIITAGFAKRIGTAKSSASGRSL
jgi:Predicted nucleoside-diphosphate sugar epimerase